MITPPPLQHHWSVRLLRHRDRELRAPPDERPRPEHPVHPPAARGPHPQAVRGHLPRQTGLRVPPGGGALLQAHLPLSLPRDSRQVDTPPQGQGGLRRARIPWGWGGGGGDINIGGD